MKVNYEKVVFHVRKPLVWLHLDGKGNGKIVPVLN